MRDVSLQNPHAALRVTFSPLLRSLSRKELKGRRGGKRKYAKFPSSVEAVEEGWREATEWYVKKLLPRTTRRFAAALLLQRRASAWVAHHAGPSTLSWTGSAGEGGTPELVRGAG